MRKTVFQLVSLLMAAALVLSSCGGGDKDTDEDTVDTGEVTDTVEQPDDIVVQPPDVVEEPVVDEDSGDDTEPVYGGTLRILGSDPTGWDHALELQVEWSTPIVSRLLTLDWWKGPAGTGEWAFSLPQAEPPTDILRGDLAESWYMPDDHTVVYKLREDVLWPEKPGVMSSRELTADDVVWNFNRYMNTKTHPFANLRPANIDSIVALDRYTIEFKTEYETGMGAYLPEIGIGASYPIIPPDVVEEYGDMEDWRNVTGTGPFMLTDYVSGSSLTFEKNPTWHMTDPEGRSLPYVDGFVALVISEVETQMTALRSGQVDLISGFGLVDWENSLSLKETNPELSFKGQGSPTSQMIQMDLRVPPFGPSEDPDALKVRRAMFMAIDWYSIAADYYEGNAEVVASNIPWRGYGFDELAIENLPEEAQELYSYNPEKARQLLEEAGYPNGFKTSLHNIGLDMYEILVAYWGDIGVEVELNTMDYGALAGLQWGKGATDMWQVYWNYSIENGWRFEAGSIGNFAGIENERIDELYGLVLRTQMTDEETDANMVETIREVITNAYEMYLPLPLENSFWQSWVKGYHGENHVGTGGTRDIPAYIWLDRN